MRSKHLEITSLWNIMRFVTTCLLPAGKTNTINFPNLTKQSKVPCKITITDIQGGEEVPVNGILCRIHAGGSEVGNYGEPTFRLTNELDLSAYRGVVERSGRVSVTVTNRELDVKRLKFYTEYEQSQGGVLIEEKVDHFENVLNDIYNKGFCTRLVIAFNKQIEALEFASVAECENSAGGQWIEPLSIPIDDELDVDDQVYTIDLTGPDLGPLYSENLNFLELRVIPKKTEGDREQLYMYITAYGFPK